MPISETGFRSHFIRDTAIDAAGGPVAYVLTALSTAAQTKDWKDRLKAQRQLSLF